MRPEEVEPSRLIARLHAAPFIGKNGIDPGKGLLQTGCRVDRADDELVELLGADLMHRLGNARHQCCRLGLLRREPA